MPDVDLADLTRGYEYRNLSSAAKERALDAVSGLTGVLVDVGGGTGGHAELWVGLCRTVVLIDPGQSMVRKAIERDCVQVIRATAQEIPIADASVRLVYFHLSLHYGSFRDALAEAIRIACPLGVIEIWTFAPETMKSSALARWFPRIGEIDEDRFPLIEDIVAMLGDHGAFVTVTDRPETVTRTAGSWRTAVENRFVSTLQFLDAAELADGLARFGRVFPDPKDLYTYTVAFVRIRATLPPLP